MTKMRLSLLAVFSLLNCNLECARVFSHARTWVRAAYEKCAYQLKKKETWKIEGRYAATDSRAQFPWEDQSYESRYARDKKAEQISYPLPHKQRLATYPFDCPMASQDGSQSVTISPTPDETHYIKLSCENEDPHHIMASLHSTSKYHAALPTHELQLSHSRLFMHAPNIAHHPNNELIAINTKKYMLRSLLPCLLIEEIHFARKDGDDLHYADTLRYKFPLGKDSIAEIAFDASGNRLGARLDRNAGVIVWKKVPSIQALIVPIAQELARKAQNRLSKLSSDSIKRFKN